MQYLLLILAKIINRTFSFAFQKEKYFNTWNYIYKLGLHGMGRITGNPIGDNGEEDVIRRLFNQDNSYDKWVVLDVGANKGQYTDAVLKNSNGKEIDLHLFEPSKSNCIFLEKKLNSLNRTGLHIRINDIGLSNKTGEFMLYTDTEGSDIASLHNLKLPLRPFNIELAEKVQVNTIDNYLTENQISRVDLLKIDVEGGEYNVILGAMNAINEGKIKNIQFEFGAGNITSRVFFHDFWTLLSEKYYFSQVLSGGLAAVEKYSPNCEIFITTNYFLKLKEGN